MEVQMFNRIPLVSGVILLASAAAQAQFSTLTWPAADLATRTYPFTQQTDGPGVNSLFGFYNVPEFIGGFDNRDAQIQLGFDTATAGITPGQPLDWYFVNSLTVTLTVESLVGTPAYDPTPDPPSTFPIVANPSAIDPDAGRAVTLFGMGFRGGYTGLEFTPGCDQPFWGPCSSTVFTCTRVFDGVPIDVDVTCPELYGPDAFGNGIRYVYPIDFEPGTGAPRDVSNNLDEPNAGAGAFMPVHFAAGQIPGKTPGTALVAGDTYTFQIDLTDPDIKNYIRQSLRDGQLGLVATSLMPASQTDTGGTGSFARFALRSTSANPPTMSITYEVRCPGDWNGDNTTAVGDILDYLADWAANDPRADVSCDGVIAVGDILDFLSAWSSGCL